MLHAVAPEFAEKAPAEQSAQMLAELAEYVPEEQTEQTAEPATLEKAPAGHEVHAVAPERENEPVPHTPEAAVSPAEEQ